MKRCLATVVLGSMMAAGIGAAACGRARAKETAPGESQNDAKVEPAQALLRRWRDSAAQLAPVSFAGSARSVLRQGDKVLAELDETFAIEAEAGAGAAHAVVTNSRDTGREMYAKGGTVWVRPRYGKLHRRAPSSSDEIAKALDDAYGALAAQLALVSEGMTVTDAGPAQPMGRPGRRIVLHAAGGKVAALDGEAILDDKTGAVVAARLEARLALDGGRTLELRCLHELKPLAGAVALPAEDDAVATPLRSADTEDREELLRGLAPPVVRRK
jgi:hypothetical protein